MVAQECPPGLGRRLLFPTILSGRLAWWEESAHHPIRWFFGEQHLRRILAVYSSYCNETCTHLALDKDALLRRPVQRYGANPMSRFCYPHSKVSLQWYNAYFMKSALETK